MKSLRALLRSLVACFSLQLSMAGAGAGDPLDQWREVETTGNAPDRAIRSGSGKWLGLKHDSLAGGSLVTSTNGRHWAVQGTFEASEHPTDLEYADGLWVLVGCRGPTNIFLQVSTNGVDWISIPTPPGADLSMQPQPHAPFVRRTPGEWFVMSMTSSWVLRSPDGLIWTASPLASPLTAMELSHPPPSGFRIVDVLYSEGRWVAVVNEDFDAFGVGSLAMSTNLTHWEWWRRPALPMNGLFHGLKYAHGLWFGVIGSHWVTCSVGTMVISSADGINWVARFAAPNASGPELGGEIALADNRLRAIASIPWQCGAITNHAPVLPIFESDPLVSLHQSGPGEIVVARASGIPVVVEASADLRHWQTMTNLPVGPAVQPLTDPGASGIPARFYRVRTP